MSGRDDGELRHDCEPSHQKAWTPTHQRDAGDTGRNAEALAPVRAFGRRDSASEIRKTRTGVVPLRMEARPASTLFSAPGDRGERHDTS